MLHVIDTEMLAAWRTAVFIPLFSLCLCVIFFYSLFFYYIFVALFAAWLFHFVSIRMVPRSYGYEVR